MNATGQKETLVNMKALSMNILYTLFTKLYIEHQTHNQNFQILSSTVTVQRPNQSKVDLRLTS